MSSNNLNVLLRKKQLYFMDIFKDISVLYSIISAVYIILVLISIADIVETIEKEENPWKQIIFLIMYLTIGISYALIAKFTSHGNH